MYRYVFAHIRLSFLYKDFEAVSNDIESKYHVECPKNNLGLAIPYFYLEKLANNLEKKLSVFVKDIYLSPLPAPTNNFSQDEYIATKNKWCLLGHYECRKVNNTSALISTKINTCLFNNLPVVYCCTQNPVDQIAAELKFIPEEKLHLLCICYLPYRAETLLPEHELIEWVTKIKSSLAILWPESYRQIPIIFGAHFTSYNYKKYLNMKEIDGIFLNNQDLKLDTFWEMVMER